MKIPAWLPARHESLAARFVLGALFLLPCAIYGQTVTDSSSSSDPTKTEDSPIVLSPFMVTSDKDEGYRSTQTVSGSRTVENLRDTPNSISILNRELIDDLAAGSVTELLAYSIAGEMSVQSQNPTPSQAGNATNPFYEFRGLISQYPLRDGILWASPNDSFSIERVEILRGPNAFLYGESGASGSMNQITKKPMPKDFTRVLFRTGSDGLLRGEVDVNRRLTDKLGLRINVVDQTQDSPNHFVGRDFRGINLGGLWRPFESTSIFANFEIGRSHQHMQEGILADGFSLTDTRGTLGPVRTSNQTAGVTYLPASGAIIDTVGQRLSSGTNFTLPIVPTQFIPNYSSFYPRETNYFGPDSYFDVKYNSAMVDIEQRVGSDLTLQASFADYDVTRDSMYPAGSLSGGIYRDLAPTRADGSRNPYYNQLYTEYYMVRRWIHSPRRMARLSALYTLKLPFMVQKIVAQATYNDNGVEGKYYSEFVDPNNPAFVGTLVPETSKAQADANSAVWSRNHFYRRFYLNDGDSARNTAFHPVAGVSTWRRTGLDSETDGDSGRFFSKDYTFYVPGWGIGSSGSYFNDRINTLVGWRRDQFYSRRTPDYYNSTVGADLPVNPAAGKVTVVAPVSKDSYNYGIVGHPFSFLSLYANYAQSVSISSSPIGSPSYIKGDIRDVGQGAGTEFGLRWSFFGGRLESNWTAYRTSNEKTFAPSPSSAVLSELSGIFGSQFDATGSDTHDETSTGLEFETVLNLTTNWRLTWNISTDKLSLTNRYPELKYFQSEADKLNKDTPLLDAFLASAPEGTPRFGFTKVRSNLVTEYTFRGGMLNNFSVGGSVQFRGSSYLGRLDLDLTGTSRDEYSPGYTLYDLFLGYEGKIAKHVVRYQVNVMNLFNKTYYRTYGPSTAGYGEGMTWRFTMRTQF